MAEVADPFRDGKFDGFLLFPPSTHQARAASMGRVTVNSMTDKPWSDHHCCAVVANRMFVEKNPVAAKRALRALLRASDLAAKQPEGAARYIVDKGYRPSYEAVLQALTEMPHGRWREMDYAADVRFWAGQLNALGLVESKPDKILAASASLGFLSELKKEMA